MELSLWQIHPTLGLLRDKHLVRARCLGSRNGLRGEEMPLSKNHGALFEDEDGQPDER